MNVGYVVVVVVVVRPFPVSAALLVLALFSVLVLLLLLLIPSLCVASLCAELLVPLPFLTAWMSIPRLATGGIAT